jgi:hypothetical protein
LWMSRCCCEPPASMFIAYHHSCDALIFIAFGFVTRPPICYSGTFKELSCCS